VKILRDLACKLYVKNKRFHLIIMYEIWKNEGRSEKKQVFNIFQVLLQFALIFMSQFRCTFV